MTGDCHVRFRGNAGVKFPCVTRLNASRQTEQADNDKKWNELEIENKYDTYRIF